MWSGGDDVNEQGQAVRLYLPIPYGRKPNVKDSRASFLGGSSTGTSPLQPCSICQGPLYRLVQLHVPSTNRNSRPARSVDRTLQVYGCNQATCVDSLFDSCQIASGKGVLVASIEALEPAVTNSSSLAKGTEATTALSPSTWTQVAVDTTDTADKKDDDWNTGDSTSMEALEAQLAALESTPNSQSDTTATAAKKSIKPTPDHTTNNNTTSPKIDTGFPAMELVSQQEPARVLEAGASLDDDDDVGLATDSKIQAMLARYMAEEEDEDILQALQGTNIGGGKSGGREKDERLSASDRAFFAYSDRLKRAPRQVLRHAYGGVPLWSIPVQTDKNDSRQQQLARVPVIPPCCGKPRVLELQLVPPLLHVLQVDKVHRDSHKNANQKDDNAWDAAGGMNWANVAIYTCQQAECVKAPYVLVQQAVDELAPKGAKPMMQLPNEPVVIPQDAQFEDDDDDDDMQGDDDDNMEDDDTDDEAC